MNRLRVLRTASVAFAAVLAGISLVSMPFMVRAVDIPSMPVAVHNTSDHDAWVDVSIGSTIGIWHISRAFCLRPGEKNSVDIHPPFEAVRVRAEIKHGDCRSGNFRVVEAQKSLFSRPSTLSATIVGAGGNYRMTF